MRPEQSGISSWNILFVIIRQAGREELDPGENKFIEVTLQRRQALRESALALSRSGRCTLRDHSEYAGFRCAARRIVRPWCADPLLWRGYLHYVRYGLRSKLALRPALEAFSWRMQCRMNCTSSCEHPVVLAGYRRSTASCT